MIYNGLILRESLDDLAVLDGLTITQTETWNVARPAAWQPKVWTALTLTGPAAEADSVAARISHALKPDWYANLSTAEDTLVIFKERVYRYRREDPVQRAAAQQHALAVGIPAWQIDWGE